MSSFRYSGTARRGPLLHLETRAAAFEFAFIASVIGIIAMAACHLIGVDIAKMAATVLTYF